MGSLGRKTFSATAPHFFKIILEHSCTDLKLNIPKKFLMKYGEDLSNSVWLKLPSGSEWEVELTRCNGKAWLERGWPEFFRFCSLDCGSFLVFRYEGNSRFEVCILDKSATEIDYPLTMPKIEEGDEDDLSMKISEDTTTCTVRRASSSLLGPCKKMRTSLSGKLDIDGKTCRKNLLRTEPLTKAEKAIALQRANAFKAHKPSFKMAMQPSHVYCGTINVPCEFAKKHLNKLTTANAILRVSDGRTWSMKFKHYHENSKARLWSGWSRFVRDNDLEVGDVCVFVLIDQNELTFEVFLFPTKEAANCSYSPGYVRGATVQGKEKRSPVYQAGSNIKCEILENKMPKIYEPVTQKPLSCSRASRVSLAAANKFTSENPFFLSPLCSIYRVKKNVYVPARFCKSVINGKKTTVKLQVKDRSWPVSLIATKCAAKLCGGWPAFAKEHYLKKGDTCIFELMEMKELVLKVHIYRR